MIILDKKLEELEKAGKPIRVGLVGAGYAGRGFALSVLEGGAGMRLVAVANRTLSKAERAYRDAGAENFIRVKNAAQLDEAIKSGRYAITDDFALLCGSKEIDAIVEATGTVAFGAEVAMEAIKNKKHLILINAELDSTLGPILKKYADEAGVVYTQTDGDQPGVLMNLYRYVRSMGFKPLLAGNIKSFLNNYATPETQKEFADKNGQSLRLATSAADGTKIAMEMATVANATGFKVLKRGMRGPKCARVEEAHKLFSTKELLDSGGAVDYIFGAEPSFGVFVLGHSDLARRMEYMRFYKMGAGPIYTFYMPYHLGPLETHHSVARAVLFRDATLAPINGLVAEVVTLAKKDLKAGEVLDEIGGFMTYGAVENYETAKAENLLPMGLAEGCTLKRDVAKDEAISYVDVKMPSDGVHYKLRSEQNKWF